MMMMKYHFYGMADNCLRQNFQKAIHTKNLLSAISLDIMMICLVHFIHFLAELTN